MNTNIQYILLINRLQFKVYSFNIDVDQTYIQRLDMHVYVG